MEMAKVTSKGQITIPVSIRRRLQINEGDKLLFINRPDGVVMVNPDKLQGGKPDEVYEEEVYAGQPAASAGRKTASAAEPAAAPNAQTATGAAHAKTSTFVYMDTGEPAPDEEVTSVDTPEKPEYTDKEEPPIPPQPQRVRAPVPDPVYPAKSGAQVKGLDIGALLDEIRSIGSNI